MRAHQIPLHWLAVSQVNPDIILTKINKRWVPFFKHSCSWSHKTQKLAGGGFQAGDRASTPLQCSSCLWPSCSPGLVSPGLPSTTSASCPLDCHPPCYPLDWTAIHHLGKLPPGLPSELENLLEKKYPPPLTLTFKMLTPSWQQLQNLTIQATKSHCS